MVDIGSSQVPLFSSQVTEQPSFPGDERKERRKWSHVEDVVLISAWLNTSKDPVIGNEQKVSTFWKRITNYFNSSKTLATEQDRESGQLKQRCQRINDLTCKFVGCYETAMKEQRSGQNEDDVMKAAHNIFYNDYMFKFNLEHCWRELRHDQKWCSASTVKDGGSQKRRKAGGTSVHPSSSETQSDGEDVSMARPPGVKAAKAAKKKGLDAGGAKEEVAKEREKSFKNMWELKQIDLALKNEVARTKVLETLLAKPPPLSETEEAVKMKLLNELLG
ncbi:glutathione S-transferase T3-like [Eutrema salsugineum]|uniref:glutathione S-transferase T3-like n=1 Tax=Eutrema salsugineum TaxID=72664 RepID=UPI000CED4CD2|nr:glutathione S-transferase T3-like [Eutrema salsugineum]